MAKQILTSVCACNLDPLLEQIASGIKEKADNQKSCPWFVIINLELPQKISGIYANIFSRFNTYNPNNLMNKIIASNIKY